ncbi:basic helix-loop-helix domain-containing protein USF3 [Solea senegalensis]|uniref:Basic helix-loop-helix domain-containing protein USF3 n=1 Tax=Solea senegalensis TaxID=28829 RepID=A0AAV6T3E4_SOLSE|nr:basic helix-loop-helix domain-containing protein USF3 [Solea senegalensis]KAG7523988.1 basic helix-loop-helix domain-containing protein USF3 [Solea senegalensis]
MPEMTDTQSSGRKSKRRKNKETHNAVERHRKEKINAGINRIGNLLPCSQPNQSKIMILDQAFRYITELKKQNDTMLLEGGDKVQAEEIRRLRRQLEELRKESTSYIELLKAHDINHLEDPTIHWKGKQRCAKVAKVMPTHQLPKGIIVYSNGNVMCPAGMETSPGKQPSETLILQPPSEVSGRLRVNGTLLQVNTSSTTPALLPGSTVTPAQSVPGLRVVEQCVVETPVAVPSVSYITLQIPTATTTLAQQPQTTTPVQTLTLAATSAPQLPIERPASPVSTCPTFIQTVTRTTASEVSSCVAQATTIKTVSYSAIPNGQALLRAGAAGSTQTTWTTLQMAGNTVQPVCQSLTTPELSNTTQAVQQVTLCPVGNKQHPIQIQLQPNVPIQQAPITAHIQAHPFQRPPQLQPAILNQAQPQPVLAPQPQCTVLPQSVIVPQSAVVAHPAVVTQAQPAILKPGSLLPSPATAIIPQPQPIPQPALVPLLQTMQVLQVKPNGTATSAVTAPQNTINPSVVILQQPSSCPAQSVVREEMANQTPCQHIVIIQASNQTAPGPQNSQVGILPAAMPSAIPPVSTHVSTTSSSTSASSLQSVGGKQLVHILPHPVQPQANQPLQVTQASSSLSMPPAPQTITVNGQVFALQPMKTSDKTSSKGSQSTLQLVQPTTTEEPTTNVALKSLGALRSLNQSISQGPPLTISSQNNSQPQAAQLSAVQQQQPTVSAPVPVTSLVLPAQQLQVPVTSGRVVTVSKPSKKRVRMASNIKRATAKRNKPVKGKELDQVQPAVVVSAKPTAAAGETQTVQIPVSQFVQPSTVKLTDSPTTCTTAVTTADGSEMTGNISSMQNSKKIIVSSSSSETVELGQSHSQSKSFVSTSHSEAVFSHTNTGAMATTVTTVNATSVTPSVSAAVVTESKSSVVSDKSTVTKVSVAEVKHPTTSTATSTTQSKSASATTAVSRQSRSVVSSAGATEAGYTSITVCTASLSPVCTTSITTTAPVSLNQATQPTTMCPPQGLNTQALISCCKPQSQPTTSSPVALSSPATQFSATQNSTTAHLTSSEFRKRISASRAPSQQSNTNMPNPSPCHPVEVKLQQAPKRDRETQEAKHSIVVEKEGLVADTSSRKDFALPQQVYTNLDDQTLEHPMTSSRQADSPTSTGAGGGRGFSVASMLPPGHNISASSGSFGTFTFTSEQAEMLALAMLEQDSPGRRSGGCTGDGTSLSNPSTSSWESSKTPPVSSNKERGSAGQQAKVAKPMDTVAIQVSVRRPVGEAGSVSGPNASRHQQNISYSQSQSLPQVQPQSSSQSGTVASLSVNNLIRPSSSQQQYPGSPSLVGQQGSVPSPVGTSAHISQPSNNTLSPCSGAAQPNEYTPLKSALMRAQAGVGVGERQVKIISKRQAQEAVMVNTGKRAKPCPPSAAPVSHMDVKVPDHSQMMVGQLLPTSSGVMTRLNPESGGPLFSTNSFMSPVVRPTDGHCPPQGPPEQNQPGVLHLPQGHPQHSASQPGQHLGGNLYMKQQQQEQQRHHLYHLQHHLTHPDPAQRHSLHQRALQQQQQQQQEQQQHVQKKRGLVRGNQTGSPAGLQQKPHHLDKSGIQQQQQQQQHSHQQQQTQHQQHTQQQQPSQQHPQQSHQQSQQHQQPSQHQQSHPQQHQQQTLQPQTQHQQHQQQQQQLQQQQQQQQSSHARHQQHLQQQIQQQQHFRHQEKSCEAQTAGSRAHHSNHLAQQEHLKTGQDHGAMQRMMGSRTLEQQLISPPSNPVSRSSDLACAPSRQERHRVSNYSAEALIGKSSSSGEQQQRMGLHLQPGHGATQEQQELCGYLDTSRGKANIAHNPQTRLPSDHPGSADVQRVSECPPFKPMGGGAHQLSGFEVQVSRGSDMAPKSVPSSQRGPQGQQQGGFRMNVGPPADGRNRGGYSGAHPGSQGLQVGPPLPREQEGCHQGFMQSLLSPHLPEQSNHQRAVQCCPSVSMEYSCVPGSSSIDLQAKTSSPSVPPTQKAPAMRLGEGNKGHISQVSSNMHGGPVMRAGLPHPPTPHSSSEPGRSSAPSRPPTAVSQHSRHIGRDTQPTKLRPGDRPRSGALRPSNPFESEGHLPLPSGGGVLLSRPQSGGEARRSTIVRFMAEGAQVPSENNLVSEQHITQNFGFPFIPEGGMNPPPPINANSTFIPPVSQSNTSRTPSLLPVEPQNTLPSFYPSYSPAAHPSLPSDVTLQYFPNQMFTSPSADKGSAPPPLNNRFGSILSPPRPVGFGQASFSLLPDMPPMPIANTSGITPHISNFSLTSLFPEIATGMPTDGSAMPMSPLLSLSNTSSADSSKQPIRPAHNISHILGHDGSSAV